METTTDPARLPAGPRAPRVIQGLKFITSRRESVSALARKYGGEFVLDLPIFGKTLLVSDPSLVRELFTAGPELLSRPTTLGEVLGPGSTFSLDGEAHRARRKLLVPPFHGKRMHSYEDIVEEEVLREVASWPEGIEFETLPSMMRITLNAILRAVFGAQGPALDELRELLPQAVVVGSRMAVLPRFFRRDFGSWSPGGRMRRYRQRYDAAIGQLIDEALADPAFENRSDVLSLLLRAQYDDGSPISNGHIADELLTLLTAGHETTATTLAWLVERVRRHPDVLRRLVDECAAGGTELAQATIWEVQRVRPVIDGTTRRARERIRLGEWVIPKGQVIMVSIGLAHANRDRFPEPARFHPERFIGPESENLKPDNYSWIPYGGGIRRCIGAAFANMEMLVTLRTLLTEFDIAPTTAPDEDYHSRGVANAPGAGGRALVYRRSAQQSDSILAPAGIAIGDETRETSNE
jgi:cytochrome P450